MLKKIKAQKVFSVYGITTILMIAAITFLVMKASMGIGETIFMLTLLTLLVGGICYWQYRSTQKKLKKSYTEGTNQPREGVLKRREILIKTDKTSSKLKLDFFDKVIEGDTFIALVQKKEFYIGFSEYMFQSKTDWLKAREIIKKIL
ncbi:MAG: hypothetical protein HUN05_18750 [Desulfobacter sp.]|nr:MAG: hypothetical protein HUN05_18750 [Desulfobacter sp.]